MESGLYDKTEKIFVGCVGKQQSDLALPPKFEVVFHNDDIHFYEIPILKIMQDLSKQEDFLIWYIHTKGVTSKESIISSSWRKKMQYFIIERHMDCIKAVEQPNCDACGIEIRNSFDKKLFDGKLRRHFSGNFWWSKSSYVKNLPDVEQTWLTHDRNRYVAEAFIGLAPKPRLYQMFKSDSKLGVPPTPVNFYQSVKLPPLPYVDGHAVNIFKRKIKLL